jgi:hypothetical protein
MAPDYTSDTLPTIITSCNNTGCSNGGGGYRSSAIIVNQAETYSDVHIVIGTVKVMMMNAEKNKHSALSLKRERSALESAMKVVKKYGRINKNGN